jgi:hypothetical protein
MPGSTLDMQAWKKWLIASLLIGGSSKDAQFRWLTSKAQNPTCEKSSASKREAVICVTWV